MQGLCDWLKANKDNCFFGVSTFVQGAIALHYNVSPLIPLALNTIGMFFIRHSNGVQQDQTVATLKAKGLMR